MVSKKHKSKRVSLHQKYKIEKKVRQHHKKIRKLAKKAKKSGLPAVTGPKSNKDPGIPNLHPYKLHMMRQIEDRQTRLEEQQVRNKMARQKLRQKKRKEQALAREEENDKMQRLLRDARRKGKQFEREQEEDDGVEGSSTGYFKKKDSSHRAFHKEVMHVIEASDVIIEVLDARDPMGCRCKGVEQKAMGAGKDKKIILLLNKIDLVPREVVAAWLKFLRQEYPTFAFKSSTQQQKNNIGRSSRDIKNASQDSLKVSESLGAGPLIQLLKKMCLTGGDGKTKTAITVGLIGYPNVGKSSVINSLKRQRSANVGATPGVTTEHKEIKLDSNIKLLDAPGIVFSKGNMINADVILRNAVKIEQIDDPTEPIDAILARCDHQQLMNMYEIGEFEDTQTFLYQICEVMKMRAHQGVPDYDRAAMMVLRDWVGGKIPYFTVPPKRKVKNTRFVDTLGEDVDLEEIEEQENELVLDRISSLNQFDQDFLMLEPGEMLEGDLEDLLSDEEEEEEEEEEYEEEEEEEDDYEDGEELEGSAPRGTASKISEAMRKRREAKMAEEEVVEETGKVRGGRDQRQDLSEFQDRFNPQTNRNIKKAMKEAKKFERRQKRKERENRRFGKRVEDEEDEDADFDFGDFVADNEVDEEQDEEDDTIYPDLDSSDDEDDFSD